MGIALPIMVVIGISQEQRPSTNLSMCQFTQHKENWTTFYSETESWG